MLPPTQTRGDPVPPTTPPPTNTTNAPPTMPSPDGKTPSHQVASDDCPQRGKGCIALIIDYSKQIWFEADFGGVNDDIGKAGCPTMYVTPELKPIPKPYVIEVFDYSDPQKLSPGGGFYAPKKKVTVVPSRAAVAEATQHNEGQAKQIAVATEAHRAGVRQGVEMAIELIKGHGAGYNEQGGTCGVVGPAEIPGADISRGTFHAGNYAAANRNVCSWLVGDFSCSAGWTPRAIDELNNTGAAACTGRAGKTINCGLHAAYESDVSVAASTADESCSNLDVVRLRGDLVKMIQRAGGGFEAKLLPGMRTSFPSHYSDRGWKYCQPHTRNGY